jgi:hypothetical protein
MGDCGVHSALYVADLQAGVTKWVAGADTYGGCLYFSPDGRALAYVLNRQLYFSRIP